MRVLHIGAQLHGQASTRAFGHFGLQCIAHHRGTGEGQRLAFAIGRDHHIAALVAVHHLGHLHQHRAVVGTQFTAARGKQHFAQGQLHALGRRLWRRRQAHAEAEARRHALGHPPQQRILGRQLRTGRHRGRVQLDDERPNGSVSTSRPSTVARRTPGMPCSWMPSLPIT
ncbi:hypothetical protein G6F66_014349 [Rhizopus arrhizus]|nr:hypothetical protein G6F66_014349 [Rhizopus arrhizus]